MVWSAMFSRAAVGLLKVEDPRPDCSWDEQKSPTAPMVPLSVGRRTSTHTPRQRHHHTGEHHQPASFGVGQLASSPDLIIILCNKRTPAEGRSPLNPYNRLPRAGAGNEYPS